MFIYVIRNTHRLKNIGKIVNNIFITTATINDTGQLRFGKILLFMPSKNYPYPLLSSASFKLSENSFAFATILFLIASLYLSLSRIISSNILPARGFPSEDHRLNELIARSFNNVSSSSHQYLKKALLYLGNTNIRCIMQCTDNSRIISINMI